MTKTKWEDYDTITCPDGTVIDMNKLKQDQQYVRTAVCRLMPWVSGIVSRMRIIYTFQIPTQATDGYNLFINPQFTAGLQMLEQIFVLAHEVMHCMLNHPRRLYGREPEKANYAMDYEINLMLGDIKPFSASLIKDDVQGLYDTKWRGMAWEDIYDNLGNQQNQQQQQQQQNQQQQQQMAADYEEGWKQAIKDYESGKLKL